MTLTISTPYKVKPNITGVIDEHHTQIIANQKLNEAQRILATYYISNKWLLCNCHKDYLPMTVKKSVAGLYFLSRIQMRGEHTENCEFNKMLVSPECNELVRGKNYIIEPSYNCELTHEDRATLMTRSPIKTIPESHKIPQFIFTMMNTGVGSKANIYKKIDDFTWCGTDLKKCLTTSQDLQKKIATLKGLADKGMDRSTLQACFYIPLKKVIFHQTGERELISSFEPYQSILIAKTSAVLGCGYDVSAKNEETYAFGVIATIGENKFGVACVFLGYKINDDSLQFATSKIERMLLRCLSTILKKNKPNGPISIFRKTFKCGDAYYTSSLSVTKDAITSLIFLNDYSNELDYLCKGSGYQAVFISTAEQNYQGFLSFIERRLLNIPAQKTIATTTSNHQHK